LQNNGYLNDSQKNFMTHALGQQKRQCCPFLHETFKKIQNFKQLELFMHITLGAEFVGQTKTDNKIFCPTLLGRGSSIRFYSLVGWS
jgi:hypothetical protein